MKVDPESVTQARDLRAEGVRANPSTDAELPGASHDPLGVISRRRRVGVRGHLELAIRSAAARLESAVERFASKVTTVGFLLALVILISIAAWMYRDTKRLISSEDWVARSHQTLEVLGSAARVGLRGSTDRTARLRHDGRGP